MSKPFISFRSEEMSLCQIYVKKDAAYSCVCELGELGLVHFNNLNEGENKLRLRFSHQMNQCDEMERILNFLQQEIKLSGIKIAEVSTADIPPAPQNREMMELHALLENMEFELLEITRNYEALRSNYFNLLEINAVLVQADHFFLDASILAWSDSLTKALLQDTNDLKGVQTRKEEGFKLGYLTGTIPIENFFAFERVLWRVCRGNFFIRHAEVEQIYQEGTVRKFVFMVFFQGELIERKIRQICQGFRTTLYQCPESSRERLKQLENMETKINDLQIVLEQTDYHRRRVLSVAAEDLAMWGIKVRKVMAVYSIMNQMSMVDGEKYLIAECWIPSQNMPQIQQALYRGGIKAGSSVPPILTQIKRKGEIPPTYNKTNRVTQGFQALIDAYGVSDYRELNPAPYTIITFPFLFAIMFGDFGHGVLVTVFAAWMVLKERQIIRKNVKSEVFKILFGGRYIVLAMGVFSMYTGLVYNVVFSKSVTIFEVAWKIRLNESTVLSNLDLQLNPETAFDKTPYIFGIDPMWGACGEAAIVTMNSFKMKIAIILGSVHMFFGMTLGAWNHIFFKNYIDLVAMCIPQMIFFCLFLYLTLLIFLKWIWYSAENPMPYNAGCAPSILIIFIDMLLFKGSAIIPEGCERYMFKDQDVLQKFIVFTALLSVPVMLFGKPLYICWKKHRFSSRERLRKLFNEQSERKVKFSNLNNGDDGLMAQIVALPSDFDSSSSFSMDSCEESIKEEWREQEMSDIFITQAIHTIECVLGSVSHTASYLRLWALSLAHDQLSGVLWKMVLRKGLQFEDWKGGIALTFTFAIWSCLTVSILVVMEGLSAFLHTLRLHWVEFQSKFYSGSGKLFQPFDFKQTLQVEDEDF